MKYFTIYIQFIAIDVCNIVHTASVFYKIKFHQIFVTMLQQVIIGHSEDAFPQCYGRTFIVQAEIVDENGKVVEQFASVAYPGYLPGYTMGFNEHGMMHSINTINPQHRNPKGTRKYNGDHDKHYISCYLYK